MNYNKIFRLGFVFGAFVLLANPVLLLNLEGADVVVTGTTMAEKRLAAIVNQEQELFEAYKNEPNRYSQSDMDFKVRSIIADYELYIADNPEDETAYILLGKLFRRVNRPEKAHEMYLHADRFNPSIPVIKQQLSNYYAENGEFEKADDYLKQAIFLDGKEPLYRYQYGTFLFFYREELLNKHIYPRAELDNKMLNAFRLAYEGEPNNRKYLERYAQAFYDVKEPDWGKAKLLWDTLLENPESELERQALKLQKAKVLALMGDLDMSQYLINQVSDSSLEFSKSELVEIIEEKKSKKFSQQIAKEEIPKKATPSSVVLENREESLDEIIARLKREHNVQIDGEEKVAEKTAAIIDDPDPVQEIGIETEPVQANSMSDLKLAEDKAIEESQNEIHSLPVDWPGFLQEENDAFEGLLLRQIDRRKDIAATRLELRDRFEAMLNQHIKVMAGTKLPEFDELSLSYAQTYGRMQSKVDHLVSEMEKGLQSLFALEKYLVKKQEYIKQKGWNIRRIDKLMVELDEKIERSKKVFRLDFEEVLYLQMEVLKVKKEYFQFVEDHKIMTALLNQS
jgi:cytochrome c-type biogenesis protein CcmH/NrfG